MKEKTIINAIKKILEIDILAIQRLKYEDSDGFYNVWKLKDSDSQYIFKQSTLKEVEAYESLKSEYLPKYYGSVKFYNKLYVLIEFVEGNNLMKSTRNNLIKVLDALICTQKTYWNSSENIGTSFENCYNSVLKRRQYLHNSLLESTYDKFCDRFINLDKTFCHNDFLPFNVIVNDSKAVFIDLEHYGILPYPLSICRLITHTKNDENYLFYMSDEDKKFAIEYYYNNFIKDYNITYNEYIMDIKYFMFYEFTEWVFVYNKYNVKKDDRFEYYLENSINLSKQL